eukprot:TRINITY_DN32973_c0_g1_i1.p1 TRINITY_DN32973_c0_g1~~TRINITY_DN32973_c0_g1_i1.p1  ORF type:complete len:635 (-),score=76.00 TRINITY_DN32973_c0_g1_i1:55-1959(-)
MATTTMSSSIPGLPEGCATDEISGSVASMMSQAREGALINEEQLLASSELPSYQAVPETSGFTLEGMPALHTPVISGRSVQQQPTLAAPPAIGSVTPCARQGPEHGVRRFVSAGAAPVQGFPQRLVSGPGYAAHTVVATAGYPVINRRPTTVNPPALAMTNPGMMTPATPSLSMHMVQSLQQTPATPMLSPASQQTQIPQQVLQSPRMSPRVSAVPVQGSPAITPRGPSISVGAGSVQFPIGTGSMQLPIRTGSVQLPVGTGSVQWPVGAGSVQLSAGSGSVQLSPRLAPVHRPSSVQIPGAYGGLQMQTQPSVDYGSLQVPAAMPSGVQRLSVASVPGTPGSFQMPPATFGNYQMLPGTPRLLTRPGSLQVPPGAMQHAQAVPAFLQKPIEIYSGYRNATGNPAGASPGRGDARASPAEQCRNTSPRSQANGSPSARSGTSGHHSPGRSPWNKSTHNSELEWIAPRRESECKPSSPRTRNRESFKTRLGRALVPEIQRRKNNEGSRSPSRGGDEDITWEHVTKTLPWVKIQTVRQAEKELRYSQPDEIHKSFVNSLRPDEPEFKPSLVASPELSPGAQSPVRKSSASRDPGLRAGSDTPRNTAAPRVPARGSATPRGYATPRGAPTTRTAFRA